MTKALGGMPVSLYLAAKHFFQPDNVEEFAQEFADLETKDREQMKDCLRSLGYVIVDRSEHLKLLPNPTARKQIADDDGPNYDPPIEVQDEGYSVGQLHPAMVAK